jgi:hypothetical protein
MKWLEVDDTESEALSRDIAQACGYPKRGTQVGSGPWQPIAETWQGPGTPGWIERPAWPSPQFNPQGDPLPNGKHNLGVHAAHWNKVDQAPGIEQRVKDALRSAVDHGPPMVLPPKAQASGETSTSTNK